MKLEEVLGVFKEAGAFLEGHFILSSGRRSPFFLQKARVFMDPEKTEKLFKALAQKVEEAQLGQIDYLVGPAVGGIIPVYEMARHLKRPAIWVEREDGTFQLRRFEIEKGARVLIVEDIATTGLSIRETIACLEKLEAVVVGACCLIDRSGGALTFSCPFIPLVEFEVPSYEVSELPPELAAIPAVKPGSRHLSS